MIEISQDPEVFKALLAKRPTRTSYSAISTYEGCGEDYKWSYIYGIERTVGDAAHRGTRLHLSGELFLDGKLTADKLPVDYWKVKTTMLQYLSDKAKSEQVWCVDKNWKIVPKDHPTTVIKAIVDIHYLKPATVLNVTDLKTGKIYPEEHQDQLQLYGTMGLVKYPKAQEVRVNGLYIDQGRSDTEAVYRRSMLPMLKKHWMDRAIKVLTTTEFLPNATPDNCKWCSHSYKKGGPCKNAV